MNLELDYLLASQQRIFECQENAFIEFSNLHNQKNLGRKINVKKAELSKLSNNPYHINPYENHFYKNLRIRGKISKIDMNF